MGHVKWVVEKKMEERKLEKLVVLVLMVGGNDFGARGVPGLAKGVLSKKELETKMEELVTYLLGRLPGVEIRVFDILPRRSERGVFEDGVRRWSSSFKCLAVGRHRHIQCWKMFTVERRSWRNKRGNGNRNSDGGDGDEDGNDAMPKNIHRIDIREELYASDGVHLNYKGQQVLVSLLDWQLMKTPSSSKELRVEITKEEERKILYLKASFRF